MTKQLNQLLFQARQQEKGPSFSIVSVSDYFLKFQIRQDNKKRVQVARLLVLVIIFFKFQIF